MSDVTGIKITGVEREAIALLHQLIMDILHANVENETKRTALKVVGKLSSVKNTYIDSNTITLKEATDE